MNLPVIESYPHVDGPTIKVRALRPCEYEYQRRRPGDIFTLKPRYINVKDDEGKPTQKLLTAEEQFSRTGAMERVESEEFEDTATGAQAALDNAVNEINDSRRPAQRKRQ